MTNDITNDIFAARLAARTGKSQAMFQEARQVLPGGVAANGKYMHPHPIYFEGARGARITDVDGNDYLDLLMGFGIHILGHAPQSVIEAVTACLQNGTMPGLATALEVALAQKVRQHMPAMEMIRFVNTGSEATLMAIRVARAYRRPNKISKFEGNYNGQYDLVQVSAVTSMGPADAPQPSPDYLGIPASALSDVLVLPYNNGQAVADLLAKHADELAAVIIEPVSAYGLGCVPADPDFLLALRQMTREHDIPLIFDEVVTNLRLGLGGACQLYGITPDLICLGKIVGGGFPIGAYGGRQDLMERFVAPTGQGSDNAEKMYQSGTFSGNAVTMAAGLAAIKALEQPGVYEYVNDLTARLCTGLDGLAEEHGIQMMTTSVKSMFQVHFGVPVIRNMRDKLKEDLSSAAVFARGLLVNEVYAPAHTLFLSTAHTQQDVDRILTVAESVLVEMKAHRAG